MASFTVRDVMSRGVWCVPLDAPLIEVARRMREEAISCVVVCDEARPVGVISERDLVAELDRVLTTDNRSERYAHEIMSTPLVTTSPDATSEMAMRTMVERRIRRLPVLSSHGTLVGVVTQSDLLRGQLAHLAVRTDTLEAQVERRTRDLLDTAQRLEESNRQRGEFLTTMSHEIRTPLSGILGTVELMLDREDDPEQRDGLETIAQSGFAMLRIVNDVLDLSKIDAGEFAIVEEPFDVRGIAENVVRLLKARADGRGNTLVAKIAPDVPRFLLGDALRIQQVVSNLVANAVKFTENGWIDIEVTAHRYDAERRRIRVEVRDTGLGMKTADVERIFLPYEQAGTDHALHAQGTGLGLTICRRLVELMGGRIGVESKHGSGSSFWIELVLEVAGRSADADAPGADRFDLAVLVVDDDNVSRRVMARLVESIGCRVDVAANGLDAVTKVDEQGYDVVLMDCEMPIFDGLEATSEIRRRRGARAPYVIAMTGRALESERDACFAAGMDDYLLKPASRADLTARLGRFVAGVRPLQGSAA